MPIAAPYLGGFRFGSLVLLVGLGACSPSRMGPDDPFADIVLPVQVTECPSNDYVPGGANRADIVALVDPPLVGGQGLDAQYVDSKDRVIGIGVNGEHLAVPHKLLWRHEIVNVELAGIPLAATYSPLSGSSMVFDRRAVGGVDLSVADQVLHNNLVMASGSGPGQELWPQMVNATNCGPALPMYPAIEMKWDGWLALYPDTRVVSNDTGWPHDYDAYPFGDYEVPHNSATFFPQADFDPRYAPKERIIGVPYPGGGGMAFPFGILQGRGGRAVFQWPVEDRSTVLFWDVNFRAAVVFEATISGQTLTFFRINRFVNGRFFDEETGSEWSFEGLAIDGPLVGTQLKQIARSVSFWFAWSTFTPNTFLMETPPDADDRLNAGKNNPPGVDPDNLLVPLDKPSWEVWKDRGGSS